jgi:polysaccharide deacetylase family protein (PEP-CTERM system associated)
MLNAFTVDVEDYFQVSAFERHIDRSTWHGYPHRVEAATARMLDLLAAHSVTATFFILGWTAHRFPQLVRRIDADGHEIASHGYWHRLVYNQTPAEFRHDIRDSRDLLADLVGRPVTAYRAPSFSITRRSAWALEILAEEGFTHDSSIFPIHHDRYGMPGADPNPHTIETTSGAIKEFPPAVLRLGKLNLPVGGGGYFRLYPFALTAACLARMQRSNGRPFMFYVHPWELDPAQPRLRAGSPLSRFRHRVNLSRTEQKLHRLLNRFPFATLTQAIEQTPAISHQPSAISHQPSAISNQQPAISNQH